MIECKLILYSNTMHLEQVYTGLSYLHRNGLINLKVEIAKSKSGGKFLSNNISVTKLFVNGKGALIDTHDNFNLYLEEIYLEGIQYYFKRAYKIDGYSEVENKYNLTVLPFGLNYAVYGDQFYWLNRYLIEPSFYRKVELFARNSNFLSRLFNLNTSAAYCNSKVIFQYPQIEQKPSVILMTRVWSTDNKKLPEDVLYKRNHLNVLRTECVIELRKKYGADFYGGIFIDEFSQKKYPNLLIPNVKLASKGQYLKSLKKNPIAVSVNGLFSSGWSIGEYTAMSKAIVTDNVRNILPYGFAVNQNYLSFTNAEECLFQVDRLFNDYDLRKKIMMANHDYYLNYLAPEKIILLIISRMLEN